MTSSRQRETEAVPREAGGGALLYLEFVHELAPCISLWQRMQAEHIPSTLGMCAARLCGRGGYGTPCLPWPCPTRRLADWAARAHAARLRRAD